MAASRWILWAALMPLLSRGGLCSPSAPACPVPCLCRAGPVFNCSSAGLSQVPPLLPAVATDLDLSQNRLTSLAPGQRSLGRLGRLWLGHNNLTHLSLCVDSRPRGPPRSRSRPGPGRRCVSWAPTLQLLDVERNQLEQLPQGLGGSRFLQVLRLSHNRISALDADELGLLPHLTELRLQHNLITSLHPRTLLGLPQLRILDLSFNLLTTLSPLAHLPLRTPGAQAELGGNLWRCDCSLRAARRWLAYDRDDGQRRRGGPPVVCASPPGLAGRELLQLEEAELACPGAEEEEEEAGAGRHRDVTAEEGAELLLPCSSPQQQGSTWWTPSGRVSGGRAGLLISEVTARDAGLYICVSGPGGDSVFLFNLEVRQTGENLPAQRGVRAFRSLPRERQPLGRQSGGPRREAGGGETRPGSQRAAESDLVLAVCLSVFITFLVAFILGVLARPLLDSLWKRIRAKRSSSPAGSASAGQAPYDNEAYSDEEPECQGGYRERRVTFSSPGHMQGDSNTVQYYDTVASDRHSDGAHDAVADAEPTTLESIQQREAPPVPAPRPSKEGRPGADDSASETSSQHDAASRDGDLSDISPYEPTGGARAMEFEPIPDPAEQGNGRSASGSPRSDRESPDTPGEGADLDRPEDGATESEERARLTWDPPLLPPPREADRTPLRQQADLPAVTPVTPPDISVGGASEIPGFFSPPFADWTPGMTDFNGLDSELWNDSGESFNFNDDSLRGASARSSSLSSGPTEYTVNPEREEEEDACVTPNRITRPEVVNPYAGPEVSGDRQRHGEGPRVPASLKDERGEEAPIESDHSASSQGRCTLTPPFGSEHSDSVQSSDDESTQYAFNQERGEVVREVTHSDPPLSPPDGHIDQSLAPERDLLSSRDSVSSTGPVEERRTREEEGSPTLEADPGPGAGWAGLRLRKGLDVKRPQEAPPRPLRAPPHPGSSSSEGEEETAEQTVKRQAPGVPHQDSSLSIGGVKVSLAPRRALNINLDSTATSTEELRWGSTYQSFEKIEPPSPLPKTSPPSSVSTEETRSGESLLGLPYLKRRLDIKPPQEAPPQTPRAPHPESSSSEGEEETAEQTGKRQAPGVPHQDSSLSIGGVQVSLAPRRALNINLDSTATSTDEMGWRTTSSTYKNEDVNLSSQMSPAKTSPLFSTSTDERSGEPSLSIGGVQVSLAPRRALNINLDSTATITEELRWGSTYQSFEKIEPPSPLPKTSPPSSVSTEETRSGESLLGLPYLKRRLDIKPPQEAPPQTPRAPHPESSSSEGEEETAEQTGKRQAPGVPHQDSSLSIGGVQVSLAPRRALNINLDSTATSTDEMGWRTTSSTYKNEDVNLSSQMSPAKTSPLFSTSTDERSGEPSLSIGGVQVSLAPRRALNINLDSTATITEELRWGSTYQSFEKIEPPSPLPKTSPPSSVSTEETRSGESLLGLPYLKRRLDIKPPQEAPPQTPRAPHPESSSSEGEEETAEQTVKRQAPGVPHQDSSLSIGGVQVSLAPRRALNINLDSTATSTDEMGWRTTSSTYKNEDVNLSSQMSPAKTSPLFSTSTDERSGEPSLSIGGVQVSLAPRRALNINLDSTATSTEELRWGSTYQSFEKIEPPSPLPKTSPPSSVSTEETRSGESLLSLPYLKRRLDIKPPQEAPPQTPRAPHPESSSSEGEEETAEQTGKRQAPGVPHQDSSLSIGGVQVSLAPRRALNINLDSTATSTDEMGWRTTSSTYKNEDVNLSSQMSPAKTSPLFSTSTDERSGEPSLSIGGVQVSLAPRRAFNINLDSTATITEELRWGSTYQSFEKIEPPSPLPKTSPPSSVSTEETRSRESLLGLTNLRRHLDIKPPQEAPPQTPLKSPHDDSSSSSSGESGDEMKVKSEKFGAKASNDSSLSVGGVHVSLPPRRTLDINLDNSASSTDEMGWRTRPEDRVGWRTRPEDRVDSGGLAALRAEGSERHTWETEDRSFLGSVSQDPPPSQLQTGPMPDTEPKARTTSPGLRIPRLRRRLVVDIQASLEAPPLTPDAPPPSGGEEAAGAQWRSQDRQAWGSLGGTVLEGSNLQASISAGDGGRRRAPQLGLLGAAKPYRPARPYQAVTSETIRQQSSIGSKDGDLNATGSAPSLHFDTRGGSEA